LPADAHLADARFAIAEDSDTVALLEDTGRLRVYDPDSRANGGALDLPVAGGSPLFLSGGRVFIADKDSLQVVSYRGGLAAENPIQVGPAAGGPTWAQARELAWAQAGETRTVLPHSMPCDAGSPRSVHRARHSQLAGQRRPLIAGRLRGIRLRRDLAIMQHHAMFTMKGDVRPTR
jgi:hypothetical protein